MRKSIFSIFIAFSAVLLFSGCSTLPQKEQHFALNPPAGATQVLEPIADPLEGYNRTVQHANAFAVKHIASHLSRFWTFITPQCLRTGLSNFNDNLGYPLHLVTNALQGDFTGSWNETKRFFVNTTIGVLGFCDPATSWLNIPAHPDTFADVLAHYDVGQGCFLNLPIIGPSTLRDTTGLLLDLPFNPLNYILPDKTGTAVTAGLMFNDEVPSLCTMEQLLASNYDNYMLTKATYTIKSNGRNTTPVMYPETLSDSGEYQMPDATLNILNAELSDEKFFYDALTHHAKLDDTHAMPYTCWPAKDSDSLVLILPGLGGARLSGTVTYLAEILHGNGASVIAISPTISPEYIENLPVAAPQGNYLYDVDDLSKVITCTLKDYRDRHGISDNCKISVIGYSLGGLNVIALAATEKNELFGNNLKADCYIAVNPPIDLIHGMKSIDKFFDIPTSWPEEKQDAITKNMFDKLAISMFGDSEIAAQYPLTLKESQFIIGLQLRISLVEYLMALEHRQPSGLLSSNSSDFNLNQFWNEAMNIKAMDYVNLWILPYYTKLTGNSADEILQNDCSVYPLKQKLAQNGNFHIIHCDNDFLLKDGDVEWMQNCLQDRMHLIHGYGHLGEIPTPEFAEMLINIINGK